MKDNRMVRKYDISAIHDNRLIKTVNGKIELKSNYCNIKNETIRANLNPCTHCQKRHPIEEAYRFES